MRRNIDLSGYANFQRVVWRVVQEIPEGETRSYAWVAGKIGRPRAARAVGQALKRNPYPGLIPCHRVICSSGMLGGFSQGLNMKKTLLERERKRDVKFHSI